MGEVVIAGGGLAGLSAAYHLGSGWRLVERDDRVGGLARTDDVDGFLFDWTGHYFHARDPYIRRWVSEDLLAGRIVEVTRKARVFSQGVFTHYPYQINTHGLPAETVAECVLGFVKAQATRWEGEPKSFGEFVLRYMGEGFAKHFMIPYNRKLYQVDLDELSPAATGRFVPRPTMEQVVRGALGLSEEAAGYNAQFWYPREGGMEALPRALAARLRGPVETGVSVRGVDVHRRRVQISDGRELPYDALIWTLPLRALAELCPDTSAPAPVREAAAKMRAVSVSVVELGAKGEARHEPFHWCYFPESEFKFYRIGSPSAVHAALAPKGHRSYSVEFAHRGAVDADALKEAAIAGLERCGIVRRDELVLVRARTIPVAYVLFDRDYEAARNALLAFAREHGIVPAGRYGLWEYSSMEDALLTGKAAAERVQKGV
jgi:protoporphyrinogen oxidase